MDHGRGRYNHYACRCAICTEAHREYQREYRRRRGSKPARGPAQHGTRSKYVGGCRCEDCTKANREYQRFMASVYRSGLSAADLLPDNLEDYYG
jgi:hypothetical protein